MSGARISALAHQHGVDADPLELVELVARVDARLRHDGLAGGHVGEQLERPLEVDAEVGEVAVVDADDVGVDDLQRALELVLVVDLDEHVEVQRARLARAARRGRSAASAATISSTASAPAAADS